MLLDRTSSIDYCTLRCSFPYVASKFHIQYQVGSHIGQQRIASNVPRSSRYDYKILSVSINQSINQASIMMYLHPAYQHQASSIMHQVSSIMHHARQERKATERRKSKRRHKAIVVVVAPRSPSEVRYGTDGKVGPKIKKHKKGYIVISACMH